MDLNLTRFGGTLPYRNIDYLGRCYDFIRLNPLDLGERRRDGGGCMPTFAIDITPEVCDLKTSDQRILIPRGSQYLGESRAEKSSRTQAWYSAHDFCDSFRNTVSGGLSIAGMFSFSASGAYSRLDRATASSQEVMTFVQSYFEDCSIVLKEDFGKVLSLSPKFIQAVSALTSEDKCAEFIRKFGTHYAQEVIFGGRMYQRIQMSREIQSSYVAKGIDFAASVEFTYKKASGSAGTGASDSSVKEIVSEKGVTVDSLRWVGGTPDRDFNTWVKSVRDDPKPVQLGLQPLHSLFTAEYFKDVKDIQTRRGWMASAMEKHIREQARFATPMTHLGNKEFYFRYQGYGKGQGPQVGKMLAIDENYTLGFKQAVLRDEPKRVAWMMEPVTDPWDEFYLKALREPGAGETQSNKLGFHSHPEVANLLYGVPERMPLRLVAVPGKTDEYYLRYPESTADSKGRTGCGLGLSRNSDRLNQGVVLFPEEDERFLSSWKLEPVPD